MAALLHPVSIFAVVVACLALAAVLWCGRALRQARSERAAAEARLQREREQLAAAESAARATLEAERELVGLKARFVSLVSHEFRTPLGIIMSAVDLLKNYRARLPAEKQEELIDDIRDSTRRMSALMEQVLLLGRVDAGQTRRPSGAVDLPALVAEITEEQRTATDGRCPILVHSSGDLAGARADVGLLRHVVSNLVSNAVKYSPAGSTVQVTLRRGADAARLEIADRGIGIPEADQARLFEAFHRAGNVGEIPGSGLGLLIVKRCVELHGGRIAVRSRPGEGTTFDVTLPLFAPTSPESATAPATATAPASPRIDGSGPAATDLAPRNIASRIVA